MKKVLRRLKTEEEREGEEDGSEGGESMEEGLHSKDPEPRLAHIITTVQRPKYIQWLFCGTKLISGK